MTENHRLPIYVCRGFKFVPKPFLTEEYVEQTLDHVPRDGDIIVASYPKTGTYWLSYIVQQIISKGESFPSMKDMTLSKLPCLDLVGAKVINSLKEPRAYRHHCPYNAMNKNPKSKVIYIYRHPENTYLSHYSFISQLMQVCGSKLDFDENFEDFLSGDIWYDSYFKNVLSYFEHQEDTNLLLVSNEKLKTNNKEEILRIAKFLGDEYHQSLVEHPCLLEKIMNNTSYQHMKKNIKVKVSDFNETDPVENLNNVMTILFFREENKEASNYFLTNEQRDRLKKTAQMFLQGTKGSRALHEWYGKEM